MLLFQADIWSGVYPIYGMWMRSITRSLIKIHSPHFYNSPHVFSPPPTSHPRDVLSRQTYSPCLCRDQIASSPSHLCRPCLFLGLTGDSNWGTPIPYPLSPSWLNKRNRWFRRRSILTRQGGPVWLGSCERAESLMTRWRSQQPHRSEGHWSELRRSRGDSSLRRVAARWGTASGSEGIGPTSPLFDSGAPD